MWKALAEFWRTSLINAQNIKRTCKIFEQWVLSLGEKSKEKTIEIGIVKWYALNGQTVDGRVNDECKHQKYWNNQIQNAPSAAVEAQTKAIIKAESN